MMRVSSGMMVGSLQIRALVSPTHRAMSPNALAAASCTCGVSLASITATCADTKSRKHAGGLDRV